MFDPSYTRWAWISLGGTLRRLPAGIAAGSEVPIGRGVGAEAASEGYDPNRPTCPRVRPLDGPVAMLIIRIDP